MGVAGGATRTALIQHQARRDNMADVAAKDGSQVSILAVIRDCRQYRTPMHCLLHSLIYV